MKPLGMAGLQAGSKIVDSLINIGEKSLDEALWGDYYRDKEVEQSQRLLDQQTEAQSCYRDWETKQRTTVINVERYKLRSTNSTPRSCRT